MRPIAFLAEGFAGFAGVAGATRSALAIHKVASTSEDLMTEAIGRIAELWYMVVFLLSAGLVAPFR